MPVGAPGGVSVPLDATIAEVATDGWHLFDPAEYNRLIATENCPGCDRFGSDLRSMDLSGTTLTGAIWPDYRVCNDKSIGECR